VISPELEERVAAAWLQSIPAQCRFAARSRVDRTTTSAIILPPPPQDLITKFLSMFITYERTDDNAFAIVRVEEIRGGKRFRLTPLDGPMHLTRDQIEAQDKLLTAKTQAALERRRRRMQEASW